MSSKGALSLNDWYWSTTPHSHRDPKNSSLMLCLEGLQGLQSHYKHHWTCLPPGVWVGSLVQLFSRGKKMTSKTAITNEQPCESQIHSRHSEDQTIPNPIIVSDCGTSTSCSTFTVRSPRGTHPLRRLPLVLVFIISCLLVLVFYLVWPTLRASLSGTFLQTLPDLVMPLKGYSLSPRSCPPTRSAPSKRFGY